MAPSHPPCWELLPQQIFLPKRINILALLTYSAGGGRGKDRVQFIFQSLFFPTPIWKELHKNKHHLSSARNTYQHPKTVVRRML